MAEEGVDYNRQIFGEVNTRVRDIEEKQRILKNRILLIGQNLIETKEKNDENNEIKVLGSSIELQIYNGIDEVTLKRCAHLDGVDDRLIEVTFGAVLSNKNPGVSVFRKEPMYVHDAGGATNSYHGFHKWLEEFLGWELPTVASSGGKEIKLYSQLVFPSFLIEQKAGWSNYLATTPYFGVKESKKRAIESIFLTSTTNWNNLGLPRHFIPSQLSLAAIY